MHEVSHTLITDDNEVIVFNYEIYETEMDFEATPVPVKYYLTLEDYLHSIIHDRQD
jgi:hypothetical protein